MAHKPFNPSSESHQQFVKATIRQLKAFEGVVGIEDERAVLNNMLVSPIK